MSVPFNPNAGYVFRILNLAVTSYVSTALKRLMPVLWVEATDLLDKGAEKLRKDPPKASVWTNNSYAQSTRYNRQNRSLLNFEDPTSGSLIDYYSVHVDIPYVVTAISHRKDEQDSFSAIMNLLFNRDLWDFEYTYPDNIDPEILDCVLPTQAITSDLSISEGSTSVYSQARLYETVVNFTLTTTVPLFTGSLSGDFIENILFKIKVLGDPVVEIPIDIGV